MFSLAKIKEIILKENELIKRSGAILKVNKSEIFHDFLNKEISLEKVSFNISFGNNSNSSISISIINVYRNTYAKLNVLIFSKL